jgi:hypothetical protein
MQGLCQKKRALMEWTSLNAGSGMGKSFFETLRRLRLDGAAADFNNQSSSSL